MFKSCCARPNKKIGKSKSKSEKMDSNSESDNENTKEKLPATDDNNTQGKDELSQPTKESVKQELNLANEEQQEISLPASSDEPVKMENIEETRNDSVSEAGEVDTLDLDLVLPKKDLTRKRYSVEYKRPRLDFKRFSVDCRRDSATLEELARLEEELARTNVDVRPGGRRKSTGILKSTTNSSNGVSENRSSSKQESDTEDDEVFEACVAKSESGENDGPREPPATPVGRDELALRRHRFFSDLVCAARAAVEHRVRFDPLGPVVADPGKALF